jgi:hypothetical protein
MSMLVRIFCLLLVGSVCSGGCIFIQTQKGTVEAAGFDVLGAPIQMVNADLLEAKTMRKLASGKKGRFDAVLYGEYTVRMAAPGFYAVDVPIRLDQATLNVRVQLTVGEECRTFSTIAGRATGAKVANGLWVKVIPVHGSGGMEAPINSNGYFVASGLDRGLYLILVMDGLTSVHTETVLLRGDTRISIAF